MPPIDFPELTTYRFEPFILVRPHIPGEIAFVEAWHERLGGASQEIDVGYLEVDMQEFYFGTPTFRLKLFDILNGLPSHATPRDAQVATSFVKWLGTAAGSDYRRKAAELSSIIAKDHDGGDSNAYLAAWVMENKRERNINNGSIQRESILYDTEGKFTCSARDLEVMELMAGWLGSKEGQEFIADATARESMLRSKAYPSAPLKIETLEA